MRTAPVKQLCVGKLQMSELKVCHMLRRHKKVWTFSFQVLCQRERKLYLVVWRNFFYMFYLFLWPWSRWRTYGVY